VMGALQLPPFRDTATQLGYPASFMAILGVWYISAGLVLLASRQPRLKEWACAAASHIAIDDDVKTVVAPGVFLILTVASWALRPPALPRERAPSLTGSPRWLSRPSWPSAVSGTYCEPITFATSLSTLATRHIC
jgi:DoxX-like family